MSTKIPRVIADLELQLATALAVGGESFTLSSATDDDGESLPAGVYVFAVDSGTSNKEYLLGQVNGTAVTAVKSVSRQGVQTTGAARAHRVGAPIILTNFAALQLVSDTLRGAVDLDGATPLAYDAEPTLGNREELATVGYVLDTATGGTVTFDSQTIAGTAGATIAAGDLVYFNEADQEWYLCDADTAATVEGVMRGIALGSGTDGVAITGGVHLAGAWTTTGLTAGAVYYASNTAGALATSAGTTKHIVGVALSTTRLWVIPQHRETIPTRTKDALAGGGSLGTPSSTNKFVTEAYVDGFGDGSDGELNISSGTTTLDAGGERVLVKNYTSISITGTAKLTISNKHADGTILILRSLGDVTITSSGDSIDLQGMGADGGTGAAPGGTAIGNSGTAGNLATSLGKTDDANGNGGGAGDAGTAGGGAGSAGAQFVEFYSLEPYQKYNNSRFISCGHGGGGGGSGSAGTGGSNTSGGDGGNGGGALIIECGGEYVFTGTYNVSGEDGASSTDASSAASATSGGGGGGGGCGMVHVTYNTLTTNAGTINAAGGAGGNSGSATAGGGPSTPAAGGGGGGGGSYLGAAGAGGAGSYSGAAATAGSAGATGAGGGGAGGASRATSGTNSGAAGGAGGASSTNLMNVISK